MDAVFIGFFASNDDSFCLLAEEIINPGISSSCGLNDDMGGTHCCAGATSLSLADFFTVLLVLVADAGLFDDVDEVDLAEFCDDVFLLALYCDSVLVKFDSLDIEDIDTGGITGLTLVFGFAL